ncbi:hypothetical protein OSTOST_07734 [Ostertagia ostertagi]
MDFLLVESVLLHPYDFQAAEEAVGLRNSELAEMDGRDVLPTTSASSKAIPGKIDGVRSPTPAVDTTEVRVVDNASSSSSRVPTSSENSDQQPTGRKWRHHAGRNRFFCDGRIIMARQINVFVFTLFLISTTLTAPFLYNEISPVLPVLPAILSFLVMVSLLKTSFSDPGILPRAPNMEVSERARQHFNEIISDPDYNPDTSALPDPPRTKQW